MWYIWLIASGIFLVAEIITIGFLIFWLSIGSLIAMIVSLFTPNVFVQMVVFVVSSSILIFATRPLANKISKKKISTNVDSLVGKKAKVIHEINTVNGTGQIKLSGEVWSAKTEYETDAIIPKDTEVNILKIDGVKAVVEPASTISMLDK